MVFYFSTRLNLKLRELDKTKNNVEVLNILYSVHTSTHRGQQINEVNEGQTLISQQMSLRCLIIKHLCSVSCYCRVVK